MGALNSIDIFERRSHYRYRIDLDLAFLIRKRGRVHTQGVGRTINIGTGGLLVAVEHVCESRSPIEMFIDWPVLFNGIRPMKLLVRGRIIRNHGGTVAVLMHHHEFLKSDKLYRVVRPVKF